MTDTDDRKACASCSCNLLCGVINVDNMSVRRCLKCGALGMRFGAAYYWDDDASSNIENKGFHDVPKRCRLVCKHRSSRYSIVGYAQEMNSCDKATWKHYVRDRVSNNSRMFSSWEKLGNLFFCTKCAPGALLKARRKYTTRRVHGL